MTAAHEGVVFDVNDCKVYPLTSDSGASPTYGDPVDVYGINTVSLAPNLVTAELKGDARIIAKKGRVDRFNLSATYGRLSADVLEVILAGAVADVDANTARWRYSAQTEMPYFALAALIEDVDNGLDAVQVIAYKCQVTGGTLLNQQADNFGQPTFDCEAIGLDCAGGSWENIMLDALWLAPGATTTLPASLP